MEPSARVRTAIARALAGATVVTLLGWSAALPAAAATVEFTISDSRITESSGLATDASNLRYWTVNDSGNAPVAYALDERGETEGTLRFRADMIDVEAVAFREGRLYVADIGDNREQRERVTVYFVDDAELGERPVLYMAYDFAYPDGPHNAETLLVDQRGRLFIVTKGAEGGIYAAPRAPSRQGTNLLERVGDAPAYVTDGTVLPDGRFALRTYVSVEVLDPDSYQVVARAATPSQRQGESITTTFDGQALLIGSEGEHSAVLRIDIPAEVGQVPAPAGTPPPVSPDAAEGASPDTATSPGPSGEVTADLASATRRQGTLVAIGLAAAVAVAAGLVVALVRRR